MSIIKVYKQQMPIKIKHLFIAAVVLTIISLLNRYLSHTFINAEKRPFGWVVVGVYQASNYLVWVLLAPLIYHFIQKNKITEFLSRKKIIIKFLLGSIVFVFVQNILATAIMLFCYYLIGEVELDNKTLVFVAKSIPKGVVGRMPEFWLLTGVFIAADYYKRYHAQKIELYKIKEELSSANLQVLKNQLRPHFLFNALNTISALIDKDGVKARGTIAKLADILSFTLQMEQKPLIPFSDEIECAKNYIDIQSLRFSNRLSVDLKISPDTFAVHTPPFILQPILENTIKHKVEKSPEKVKIIVETKIIEENLEIDIEDIYTNLQEDIGLDKKTSGTGLKNLKERLFTIYGNKASLATNITKKGGFLVSIQIPLNQKTGGIE